MNKINKVNIDTYCYIAAKQAKDAINANHTLLRNYHIELLVDDGHCQADSVLKAFIDHIMQQKYKNLVGILGV